MIFAIISKWTLSFIALLAVYFIIHELNHKRLVKKYGAKPAANYLGDNLYGYRAWYTLMKLKNEGTLVDWMDNRYKITKHPHISTLEGKTFGRSFHLTRDCENIKAVLATQFNDFCLGQRHGQFGPLLGDGIFTLDGEGWKHSRTMLRPQFSREQVSHVNSLEIHMQHLFLHIKKSNGQKFDIQDYFYRYTVDASTGLLFGESVLGLKDSSIGFDVKHNDEDGREHFADAFNRSQTHISNRVVLMDKYFLYNTPDFRKSIKQVHKFANYYVKQALSLSPEELEKKSANSYIFLYELVKQTRDPAVLRDQLLNILVAARDTTASLLSSTFFELARNKDILQKLQEEIWTKFGKGENIRLEDITFESLKSCEYLKSVLNETLRLYPAVPLNFRFATKNTTLPKGGGPDGEDPVFIPKKGIIMYNVGALHRDPIHYGKDADVYRPERWSEPSTRSLGWAYLPFNGGPRICLGQQFALTEASYVVVRLLQNFHNLESFDEEYPPKKANHLTLSLKDGCNIALY